MTITRTCPLCGKVSTITCKGPQWFAYENGALIQDAFPDMDLQTRETIISGLCVPCQAPFFDEEEDEEDYYEDWDDLEVGFDPYMGCYSDDC